MKFSASEYVRDGLDLCSRVLAEGGALTVKELADQAGMTSRQVENALRPWVMQDVPGSTRLFVTLLRGGEPADVSQMRPTDTVVVNPVSWFEPEHSLFLRAEERTRLEWGLDVLADAGPAVDQDAVRSLRQKFSGLLDADRAGLVTDLEAGRTGFQPQSSAPDELVRAFGRRRVRVTVAGEPSTEVVGDAVRWSRRDGRTVVCIVEPGADAGRWITVDMVQSAQALDDPVDPHATDVADATPVWTIGRAVTVELEVAQRAAWAVQRYGLTPVEGASAGRFRKEFPAVESAVRMVLAVAPDVRVVGPDKVRAAVAQRAAELLDRARRAT